MKNLFTPIKLSVSLVALLLSQASFAAGTDAGVLVTNTASISYSVGSTPQTAISSAPAVFTVDRKINLTVTGTSTNNLLKVVPLSVDNELNYTVQNTGNSDEFFKIEVGHLGTPDDTFDAGTTAQICEFTVDNTTYDITDTPIIQLDEDETQAIVISCDMPDRSATFADGDTSTIKVVATAVADNTGTAYVEDKNTADVIGDIDVVFADELGTDDASRDAKYSARETYQVEMPMLSVLKSSLVLEDPINGTSNPKRIPGATVQYTITVENYSETSQATGVVVTDSLKAEVDLGKFAFEAGSIVNASGDSAPAATNFNSTTQVVTAGGITVPVATSASDPGTAVVTFNVIITE